eukprot:scpid25982/ scgid27153/ Fibrillin-2
MTWSFCLTAAVAAVLAAGMAAGNEDISGMCGLSLDAVHQGRRVVSHEGFPGAYEDNVHCQFSLNAPVNRRVFIVFEHFNLEAVEGCQYDVLQIYDGRSTQDRRISNLCGRELPQPVMSSGGRVTLVFKTDSSISHSGFAFRFFFCESTCCEVKYMPNGDAGGAVTSPNHPQPYLNNQVCTYHFITESHSQRVKLTFRQFALENRARCESDYITVRDGLKADSCTSDRFCASSAPPEFVSSSHTLTLIFKSSGGRLANRGFRAEYCQVGSDPSPAVDSCALMRGCCQGRCTSVRSRAICSCQRGQELMPDQQTCECPNYCLSSGSARHELFAIGTRVVPGCDMPASMRPYISDGMIGEVVRVQHSRVQVMWSNNRLRWHRLCQGGRTDITLFDLSSSQQGQVGENQEVATNVPRSCDFLNGNCDHICRTVASRPVCACLEGFFLAAVDERTCLLDVCQDNNGGCQDYCTALGNGTRECSCSRGFTLKDNQRDCIDTDECGFASQPCEQQCVNNVGSFRCECDLPGYRLATNLRNCSDIDECLDPAIHHCSQQCVNTRGSFYCECGEGYRLSANRRTCEDIDECYGGPGMRCQGDCENLPGTYRCTCGLGFRLAEDQRSCVDIPECIELASEILLEGNCLECLELSPGYQCTRCRNGYAFSEDSTYCKEIDECAANNGGCAQQCTNMPGNFSCSCFPGYSVIRFYNSALSSNVDECVNIDECATDNGGCTDGCVDTPGSFECQCPSGAHLLADNRTCQDLDECAVNNGGCAQICRNTALSFSCSCSQGYRVAQDDTSACDNVNECLADDGGCSGNGSRCQDVAGSFLCLCESGYQLMGDLRTCEDVDECSHSNGGCQSICENTDGSFECSCTQGFRAPAISPQFCVDIDECQEEQDLCNMTCSNTVGSYVCSCQQGYRLMDDQSACSDIDECGDGTAGCGQNCQNTMGGYVCSCRGGYTMLNDSHLCEDMNECSAGLSCCSDGCSNTDGSYRCQCGEGFYLDTDGCTCRDIPECSQDNGGCEHQCIEEQGSYRCQCNAGFAADRYNSTQCHDIDECHPDRNTLIVNSSVPERSPCEQRCENLDGTYRCHCRELFKIRPDQHTCQRCPTCETFTLLQETVAQLLIEVSILKQEVAQLRGDASGLPPPSATPAARTRVEADPLLLIPVANGDAGDITIPDYTGK